MPTASPSEKSIAEQALQSVKTAGASNAQVSVAFRERTELNVESNQISLLRTTLDRGVQCKVIVDGKYGVATTNQTDASALKDLSSQAVQTAKASAPDDAYHLAGNQGHHAFKNSSFINNPDWMYQLLSDFLHDCRHEFPKTIIENAIVQFIQEREVLMNSDGTFLESYQSTYDGSVVFTTKDGKKSSSTNYCGFILNRQGRSLFDFSGLRELLKQSTEQTVLQKIPYRGMGDILVTPHCLEGLLGDIFSYLQAPRLLRKSSFLQNSLGKRVASDAFTVKSHPIGSEFVHQNFWTNDGYVATNETLFERGVLRSYLLDSYGARKLGLPRSLSGGSHIIVPPGNVALKDQIANIENGLLLCRLSSGNPSEAGDFSGVAKNSYYIHNGKIQFPVSETMIAGNYANLLHNIQSASQETIHLGSAILPYLQIKNLIIS